ncbi:hypothetical protein RF55_12412 [Lasius niger]|uniref:Uncharacterized protein n=1 Tax=Lasius niger TaxID=67767 RepID=A0A0J7N642_LASNI|nr:hypothetical protein RF55_12412 [Lasius niger]
MSNKEETEKKQKDKEEKKKKEEKRKTQNDDFGSDFTVDENTFLRAEILNLQKQLASVVAKTQHLMPTQTSNEALHEPLQESNSTQVLKEVPQEKICIKTKIQPAGHGQEDGTGAEHVKRVVVGRVIDEPVVDVTEMSILATIKAGSTISVVNRVVCRNVAEIQ